jgi:hypothetical protein
MRTHCLLLVCSWSLAVVCGEPEGGSFTRTIKREFKNADEETLIKAAEAVIPPRAEVLKAMPERCRETKETREAKNLWWCKGGGGFRVPYAITSDAIQYYSDHIDRLRKGDFSGLGEGKWREATMNYLAKVEFRKEYEVEGKKFADVNVVMLELQWRALCGDECGIVLDAKRVVVFDKGKKILGVFLDGKVEGEVF